MVKIAEDLQVKYDNTVRGVNESIIQFSYGDISLDPKSSVVLNDEVHVCDVSRLVKKLNYQHEQQKQKSNKSNKTKKTTNTTNTTKKTKSHKN